MEFLAILLAYCTGPDGVHPDPGALDRLENLRESSRAILSCFRDLSHDSTDRRIVGCPDHT